ncbi:coiled-coil domain-containing protein [Oopsacas minuta]|uniref:Coiled-coil domain-containing protein n=1 Tax=Oopsacas minuta TaxID=111878 RepID=A0AAV7JXI7_9METZ|nr:coiled-coil domain-containing protein [Oopsacas minuta]
MSKDKVLSEAESIVYSWYKRDKSKKHSPVSNPVTSVMDDVITSAFHQANHGNVAGAVEGILNGLRDLPIEEQVLSDVEKYWLAKNRDPRIGIEKRQRELKEKRRVREEERIKQEYRERESHVLHDAGTITKKESSKAEYHKRRIAEAVLHHQVNSFRDEVRREAINRREELTSYYTAKIKSTAKPQANIIPVKDSIREAQSIVNERSHHDVNGSPLTCAEQLISAKKSAAKLSHTRRILIAQLEEATNLEAKHNLKLTHRVFSSWHSLAAQNRIRLDNARTMDDWKNLCRVFSAWKAVVSKAKQEKDREKLAEKMVKERQADTLALEFFSCKLMRNCFVSWKIWARNTGELKRHADKIREKRIKMAIFLEAAEKGKISQENKPARQIRKSQSHPLDIPINVGDLYDTKIDLITMKSVREKLNSKSVKNTEKKISRPQSAIVTMDNEVTTMSIPKSISITIPDVIPVEGPVLTAGEPVAPLYVPPDPPAPLLHPKKFTTPIPLTQMEERNALILRRKREREEKRKLLEEEKAARELELETNRIREEDEMKRAEIARRQEEKRAAKAREIEKELAREKTAKQNRIAISHYEKYLLKRYCLGGLVKYRTIQVKKCIKADNLYKKSVQREFFPIWKDALIIREKLKCDRADKLLHKLRKSRIWRNWRLYVQHYNELDTMATEFADRNALKRCLAAWKDSTRNDVLLTLRHNFEADKFYDKMLLRWGFLGFKNFIPTMIEEREREIRKEKLREQVREIIPDYGKYIDK